MKRSEQKPKRLNVRMVLIILLFVFGLGLLLYPTIQSAVSDFCMQQEISRHNEVLAGAKEDYSRYWEKADEYNVYLQSKPNQLSASREEMDYVLSLLEPFDNQMMGTLEIEKLHLVLPIYPGTDEKQLQAGAGWWPGSSLPAGGNTTHTVLTGHTGLIKARLFTDIDKLEPEDRIIVHVLDRTLVYEMKSMEILEPDETKPLHLSENKDLLTLYTCYPYGINTQRLAIHAIRSSDLGLPAEIDHDSAAPFFLLAAAAGVLSVIIVLLVLRRKKKQPL